MDLAYVSRNGFVAIVHQFSCWYVNMMQNRLDFPLGSYLGLRDALLSS